MYLCWFDDNPKKTTETKVAEAIQAYRERFGASPNVVLMNAEDLIEIDGVQARSVGYIRKSHFWIGWEDGAGQASNLASAAQQETR